MAEDYEQSLIPLQTSDSPSDTPRGLINDIDFGDRWNQDLKKRLDDATEVFGLLTITDEASTTDDESQEGTQEELVLEQPAEQVKPGQSQGGTVEELVLEQPAQTTKPDESQGGTVEELVLEQPALKPGEARGAMDEKAVNKLVEDLGDDDFDTRQKASRELEKVAYDPVARRALEKATTHTDLEIKNRAATILKKVEPLVGVKEGAQPVMLIANPDGTVFSIGIQAGESKPGGGAGAGRAK